MRRAWRRFWVCPAHKVYEVGSVNCLRHRWHRGECRGFVRPSITVTTTDYRDLTSMVITPGDSWNVPRPVPELP